MQRSVRLEAPLVSLIGGLPTLRSRRAGSPDSLGYLERADWHELAALDGKARRYALQETARLSGRSMTSEAANRLLELAGGYPYAIQVVGRHAWRASQNSRTIEIDHADAALAPAAAELARTLYSGRWAQTSRTERQYLTTLAEIEASGRPMTSRAVADRLGRRLPQLSPIRARLLEAGTIMAVGDRLQFTVPGFGAWISQQPRPSTA